MQLTAGNAAGVMIPFMYVKGPRYIKGHAVSLAMVLMGGAVYGVLWWEYRRVNRKREMGKEDWKMEGKSGMEVREMGDDS